jgi:hypothetical protein
LANTVDIIRPITEAADSCARSLPLSNIMQDRLEDATFGSYRLFSALRFRAKHGKCNLWLHTGSLRV